MGTRYKTIKSMKYGVIGEIAYSDVTGNGHIVNCIGGAQATYLASSNLTYYNGKIYDQGDCLETIVRESCNRKMGK